jgi:hypothetical protein
MIEPNGSTPVLTRTTVGDLLAAGKALHDGLKRDERSALEKAIQLGAVLNQLKEMCSHGEYLPALEKMGVPHQRASEYCRIAKVPPVALSACETLNDARRAIADTPEPEQPSSSHQTAPANQQCRAPQTRAERVGQVPPKSFVLPERQSGDGTESEAAAEETMESCPESPAEGEPKIPERLKPYFEHLPLFEQAPRLAERLANLLQQIEQTPAYRKAVEGKKHRENSTYVRSAGRDIESLTPKRPCPVCGPGEHVPSPDSEPCTACGDKGYQTADEAAE